MAIIQLEYIEFNDNNGSVPKTIRNFSTYIKQTKSNKLMRLKMPVK